MAYEAPASPLTDDFSVLEGTIIMPIQGEYMVDLDESSGLNVGDILTVVKGGERVFDPDAKKVLGSLDIPIGFLQVTRVNSGYSYTKPLSESFQPNKGEKVKRFAQVPTQLSSEIAKPLAALLKAQLPQLNWDAETPLLTFTVQGQNLVVIDQQKNPQKRYQLDPNTGVVVGYNSIANTADSPVEEEDDGYRGVVNRVLNRTLDNLLEVVGVGSEMRDERLDTPEIIQNSPRNKAIKAYIPIDEKLVGITIADLDNDQRQETFVATQNRVGIFLIGQSGFRLAGSINLPADTQILSLDSGDLNGDGMPELYINAATGTKLSSRIIEFKNQQYTATLTDSDWFSRVISLQGKPALVGQKAGELQTAFTGPLALLSHHENTLTVDEYIKLPEDATVFAFMPMPENPAQHYAYISKNNDLVVRDGSGTKVWQSTHKFGGSELSLSTTTTQQQPVYVQPKIQQLPSGEIVVAWNDDDKLQEQLTGRSSKVIGLTWDNKQLVEKWHTDKLLGQLADIAIGDADNDGQPDLVTVLQLPKKNAQDKDQSSIILYQLQ
jgi:hypothetical protein